jgi:hypothetical protein
MGRMEWFVTTKLKYISDRAIRARGVTFDSCDSCLRTHNYH